ncbi:MAG: phospholipid carrier-dependent glycosyltransferase, partial [Chloroflexi bacterium]|nr:phospholipid carrier-dependent glycosyltransferase [Chloroflexota bacterium]
MTTSHSFLAPRKTLLWALLALIFLLGLGVRLYDLTDAPLDFHPTRQLHSALIARGMYEQGRADLPQWQRDMAVQQWKAEGLIEPPILEWLTAQTYALSGAEQLWVARIYSIVFWMAASIGLYLLARDLAGIDGALAGFFFFLTLPYAVIASRAFQPDPLMTSLIVFALWALVRWQRSPNWNWALAAGGLAGLAILVKAVAVFFVGGAFIGFLLLAVRPRDGLRNPQLLGMAALAILPYAVYHIYGVYISGLLQSQFSDRFFPEMWIDPGFYLRWLAKIDQVIGFPWLIVALTGIFVLREPAQRGMLLGAWIGYALLGFTLPHHISTHDYYSLPLVPLASLGIAGVVSVTLRNLRGPRWMVYPAVLAVLLLWMVYPAYQARTALKKVDYSAEVAKYQAIGQELGPGSSVVALSPDYGYRLSYWAWINPNNWLSTADQDWQAQIGQGVDFSTYFEQQAGGKDYFVVTSLDELDQQPELRQYLYQHFAVLHDSDDYLIFD